LTVRVAIVGAGIVGVTTAYELALAGHEVTVYERRGGVAAETSFANAGVVSPGYVTPWAAPGMPWKVLRQLGSRHAAVRLSAGGALRQLPWLWRWWRACTPPAFARNRTALWQLARASQQRLAELTKTLRLDYEQHDGFMVLLRGAPELALARPGLKLLAELGVEFELVDAEHARALEPGLNADTALRAAVRLPRDGVGNCRQFAQQLKAEAQRLGAGFRFDADVQRVVAGARPAVICAGNEAVFDAVVLASGVESNALLKPLGLKLPLAPVWGYSITAPLRHVDGHPDLGPRGALMDEKYKVAISRLGQRVRVAGSAEIGGAAHDFHPRALATLYKVLDDWFPGAALTAQAQRWKGARPMLPDGPPVVGASGAPGVWLNLGHGSSGWALSCGSARLLAERIGGRTPAAATSAFGIERLR
jgi:D-amino-acid dehydrogenase